MGWAGLGVVAGRGRLRAVAGPWIDNWKRLLWVFTCSMLLYRSSLRSGVLWRKTLKP